MLSDPRRLLLWFLPPQRSSHVTAVAIHALLGISNIAFWQLFVSTGTLVMGWITTSVHLSLVVLQAIAAVTRTRR